MTYYHNTPRTFSSSESSSALTHIGHPPKSESPTGSDEGYPYMQEKGENDYEDTSLTSQTLNADGTPKRPMNAFMIFARKRRPQLSAENQSMRTGEISKILSKEWNSMNPTEKQYFQDQAKLLKDSFNSKYPDYVYRRRPNNSRKKRKPDGSGNRQDGSLDCGEDYGAGDDLREPSDPDDVDHSLPLSSSHSRASHHPYAHSESLYRPGAVMQDHRLGYPPSNSERTASDALLRSSSRGPPSHRYYGSSHSQPGAPLGTEPSSYVGNWERIPSATSWYGHDRHTPTLAKPYAPGPPSWSTDSTLPPPNSSHSNNSNYSFPTLNSPFYPNQKSGDSAAYSGSSPESSNSYPAVGESNPSPRYGSRYSLRYEESPNITHTAPFRSPTDQDANYYSPSSINRRASQVHSSDSSSSAAPDASASHTTPLPQQFGYWPDSRGDGR